ncbi:MAG: hypothetical protein JRE65_05290 [Deltaproteobacteria bacterium]|jgi:hypothetical protein|nr:hypothetical protein [Deltaproteobacteria bacterium]
MKLKWIVIPAVILVAVLIFVFFIKKNKDIPENLIGKWTTSEPRYEDRFFEIKKETIVYGLGGDKQDVYFVSNLETRLQGNQILYTLSCKDTDGLKFTRSFFYELINGGVIRFKNQKNIKWMKKKDDAVKEN